MRVYENISANFELRIQGFAIEMFTIFFSILVVIFVVFHPIIEGLIVFMPYYFTSIFPFFFTKGQSLGKMHAKTKIITVDGDVPSTGILHLRELFKWIMGFITIGLYFVVAFIIFTKHQEKRTIHDFIFNTKVVEKEARYTG